MCFTKESLIEVIVIMDTQSTLNQNPFIKESQGVQPVAKTLPTNPTSSNHVMQSFTPEKKRIPFITVVLVFLLVIGLGVGAGYGASVYSAQTGTTLIPKALNPNAPVKGKTYGDGDVATFKDVAEGNLQSGGIEGEGQYHLVRLGGDSQNVYLTSSSVDLSQFIGSKVKVWGQTQAAQKAGWLMDVGKIQTE
jgi:hypothetical protein